MPENEEKKTVINAPLNVLRTANARKQEQQEAVECGKFQPYMEEIAKQIATAVTARIIAALADAGYIPGKLEVTAAETPPAKPDDGKKAAKKEVKNG